MSQEGVVYFFHSKATCLVVEDCSAGAISRSCVFFVKLAGRRQIRNCPSAAQREFCGAAEVPQAYEKHTRRKRREAMFALLRSVPLWTVRASRGRLAAMSHSKIHLIASLAFAIATLTLTSCASKTQENKAVTALKNEKNAWERESNNVADEATANVEAASEKTAEESDEIQ